MFNKETTKTDIADGVRNPCGPNRALFFSDTEGLSLFGALEEITSTSSSSSIKHVPAGKDEMNYVLKEEVTLHEGTTGSSRTQATLQLPILLHSRYSSLWKQIRAANPNDGCCKLNQSLFLSIATIFGDNSQCQAASLT